MAEPDEAPAGYMAGFTGVKRTREPSPLVDADPGERIKDMDHEGVDVNLTLPSGWFGTWTAGDDEFSPDDFHLLRYPNYGALTFTPAGLSPAEHASLTWTHL